MTNNIKLMRLITNDDIIADVEPVREGEHNDLVAWKLRKGLRIIILPDNTSPAGAKIMLQPVAPFGDSEILEIKDSHVLYMTDPDTQFRNEYIKTTSSILRPVQMNQAPKLNIV